MSTQFSRGAIGDIAFSPDTRYLAVATSAGVEILDAQTLNGVNFLTLAAGCHSVAFSPDGKMLTGSEGRREYGSHGDVTFWDVATAQIIDKMESYGWLRLGFSPDGQIIAGWDTWADGGIYLWDTCAITYCLIISIKTRFERVYTVVQNKNEIFGRPNNRLVKRKT